MLKPHRGVFCVIGRALLSLFPYCVQRGRERVRERENGGEKATGERVEKRNIFLFPCERPVGATGKNGAKE